MAVTAPTKPVDGETTARVPSLVARVRRRPSPNLIGVLVCAALGIVSILTLPSIPSYDPFSWVIWGHELAHHIIAPHEAFVSRGGPSWKPLPVLFTTIFGFFGPSVKLWVAFARAAGLFGLFIAYRLGSRLGSSPRWRLAGPIAGVLAVLGIFLTSEWTHYMFRATSEPMVVTATLYAIERHVSGKRMTAFFSGIALAMLRPESGVFVGFYALWCFITIPRVWTRLTLVAGLVLVPVAWTVPTWISSSDPLLASRHARAYNGDLGAHPFDEVLKRATNLSVWPVIIAAGAVTLLALRTRDRLVLILAVGALGYVAVVEAMTADHYPGLERFMLPAAAIAAVLAGVAVVRFATFAGGGIRSLAVSVVLVAIAVPFFDGRIVAARPERGITQRAVDIYGAMVTAINRAGGPGRVFPCVSSTVAINHSLQPSFAWATHMPLIRVTPVTRTATSLHDPTLAFFAPVNTVTGGRPHRFVDGLRGHLLLRSRGWSVYRVTRRYDLVGNACVGR